MVYAMLGMALTIPLTAAVPYPEDIHIHIHGLASNNGNTLVEPEPEPAPEPAPEPEPEPGPAWQNRGHSDYTSWNTEYCVMYKQSEGAKCPTPCCPSKWGSCKNGWCSCLKCQPA